MEALQGDTQLQVSGQHHVCYNVGGLAGGKKKRLKLLVTYFSFIPLAMSEFVKLVKASLVYKINISRTTCTGVFAVAEAGFASCYMFERRPLWSNITHCTF